MGEADKAKVARETELVQVQVGGELGAGGKQSARVRREYDHVLKGFGEPLYLGPIAIH
jgi:hypothetical protein